MTKVKTAFWTMLVLVAVVLIVPRLSDDGLSGEPEHQYGPRQTGIAKEFNCRFMTVEAQVVLTDEQRARGLRSMRSRMVADIGHGITSNWADLPDFPKTGTLYKQEFCAKPGTRVAFTFQHVEEVTDSACLFFKGPRRGLDMVGKIDLENPGNWAALCTAVIP